MLLEVLLWILDHLFIYVVVPLNQGYVLVRKPQSLEKAAMEQERQGISSAGGHVARGDLGAVIQELGWQGSWHLGHLSGCVLWEALRFPPDCRAAQKKMFFCFCRQLYLGNGAVCVQNNKGILDLIAALAHLSLVLTLFQLRG